MARNESPPLEAEEFECLRRMGEHVIPDPALCTQPVLQALLAKGLIEQIVQVWLPLEMRRTAYRPTDQGWQALKTAEPGKPH